jgi:hypothetical protein
MSQIIIVAVLLGFGIVVVVGLFLLNRSKAPGSGKDSSTDASTADAPHHSSSDGGGDSGGGDGGGD